MLRCEDVLCTACSQLSDNNKDIYIQRKLEQ